MIVQFKKEIKKSGGACLRFAQSIKHAQYLMNLYYFFNIFVKTPPKAYEKSLQGNLYVQLYFQTKIFSFFTSLYVTFYPNGTKTIPFTFIKKHLTPISLAFWFMDDGAKAGSGYMYHTDGFSKEDVLRLIFILNKKFDLNCNIWSRTDK